MKKKGKYLFLAICTMCLTGCSLSEEEPSKMGQIQTETLKQVEEGIQLEEDYTLDLKDNYKIFTTLVSVTFFTKRERGDGGKQRTVYTDSIRK